MPVTEFGLLAAPLLRFVFPSSFAFDRQTIVGGLDTNIIFGQPRQFGVNQQIIAGLSYFHARNPAKITRFRDAGGTPRSPQPERSIKSSVKRRINVIGLIVKNSPGLTEKTEVQPGPPRERRRGLLDKLTAPMLVIGGALDSQVPIADSDLLLNSGQVPKDAWINPLGGHMGRDAQGWSDARIFKTVTVPWILRHKDVKTAEASVR